MEKIADARTREEFWLEVSRCLREAAADVSAYAAVHANNILDAGPGERERDAEVARGFARVIWRQRELFEIHNLIEKVTEDYLSAVQIRFAESWNTERRFDEWWKGRGPSPLKIEVVNACVDCGSRLPPGSPAWYNYTLKRWICLECEVTNRPARVGHRMGYCPCI
jgi:hypothetical protein